MEPHEEIEFKAEELVNRTGIMNNPELAAELIRGVEETPPHPDMDGGEIAEVRSEYVAEALPIGSKPMLVDGHEGEISEQTEALVVLLDKLGERLAFERRGTRLYEVFLQKFESTAVEEESGPSAAELRHICDEEFEHFKMLQQAIASLGGDATVLTPSADIVEVLSNGAVEVVSDPRTTIAQSLQALLTAELADNDGWQMLGELAAQLGLEELEQQCRSAFEKEQEHLEKVRRWLLSMTLDEAQGGVELGKLEEDTTDGEAESEEAQAETKTKGAGKLDALELLKEDHQRVKELFEEVDATEDDKQKRKLFKEIKKELETHTRIEESVFYPAMQEYEQLKDMVLESIEEHKQVKKLLRELGKLSKNSDRFAPKLKVLQENVEHHAEEEEEGKMFPKILELLDASELEELGEELEAAKHQRQRKAS